MTALALHDPHAQMGKISNNLEKHGEEDVTAFSVPLQIGLPEEQLDALMGKYFHRSLYNRKGEVWEIVDGFRRCEPIVLTDTYEGLNAALVFPGDDDGLKFAECKLRKLVLEPKHGGITQLTCSLYLRPGLGDENLVLQEHQRRAVSITISGGKIALKKNPGQPDLPFGSKAEGQGGEGTAPPDLHRPPPFEGPSGAEVDARMRAAHPEAAGETMGADGWRKNEAGELEKFEANTQAHIDAFNAQPGEVIDGRSERVKHEDEQREHEAAA